MFVKTIRVLTKQYNEFDVITPQVEEIAAQSGVQNGLVTEIGRASCRERVYREV